MSGSWQNFSWFSLRFSGLTWLPAPLKQKEMPAAGEAVTSPGLNFAMGLELTGEASYVTDAGTNAKHVIDAMLLKGIGSDLRGFHLLFGIGFRN